MKCISPLNYRLVSIIILLTLSVSVPAQERNVRIHSEWKSFIKKSERTYIKVKSTEVAQSLEQQKIFDEYIANGNRFAAENKFKPAVEEFMKAHKLMQANAEAFYYLGMLKLKMEDYSNALPEFDKAVQFDSLSSLTYFERGNAKFQMKNYPEALNDYSKAISLDSTDASFYFNRAITNYSSGKNIPACSDLKKAFTLGDEEAGRLSKEVCSNGY